MKTKYTTAETTELRAGISAPPYESVSGLNGGDYGSGPDTHSGFTSYAVVNAEGQTIVDTFNSTIAEIHEDVDEDGLQAWDEVGRRNVAFFAAAPAIIDQLLARNAELEEEKARLTEELADAIRLAESHYEDRKKETQRATCKADAVREMREACVAAVKALIPWDGTWIAKTAAVNALEKVEENHGE